ncbi:MAG: putative quinol monooxygenase [Limnohabitans sp.]
MSDTTAVRKLAELRSHPGQSDPLREALVELETLTRTETGCLYFEFFQALTDPEAFVLLEEFENEAALEEHLSASYTQSFFAAQLVANVVVRQLD